MTQSLSTPWFRASLLLAVATAGWFLLPGTQAESLTATPVQVSPAPASSGSPSQPSRPTGGGLPSFADLADRVLPAVVSVEAQTIERSEGGEEFSHPFGLLPPGLRPQQPPGRPREFRQDSGGSGFLVSADGYVVTNHHVIEGATTVRVRIDQRTLEARVQGSDPGTDLAILKVEAGQPLPFLELGDSDRLRVGDWVMAIGNPLLLDHTVTVGVVSAKGRSIGITADSSLENFIQTDAAINRGNSGGPLVDLDGRVVGIATAMNWGAENIGFAVPVNTLRAILPQLKEKGRVSRGYLGIQISNLSPEMAEAFGAPGLRGVLVQEVVPGGPAERAGLQHGDILLKADGREVLDTRELIQYISSRPPGSRVRVELRRGQKILTKEVTLAERELAAEAASPEAEDDPKLKGLEWLGIEVAELSDAVRRRFGLPEQLRGVLVTEVSPSSALYDNLVRPGDVVLEVNGQPIDSVSSFRREVSKLRSGEFLRLYLGRLDPTPARRLSRYFAVVKVP